jgi:chemotaxis protein methyltransferase CheR
MVAVAKVASTSPRESAGDLLADIESHVEREFEFSDSDFRSLVQFAYTHTGISLSDSKRNLVYGRLSRRLRALGLTSFRDYRAFLESPDGEREIQGFINSISTNLTKLFREAHHFEHLRTNVAMPYAQSAKLAPGPRLRIWSAGCSTGEEPYTISMVLKHEIPRLTQYDIRILATDIDTEVLKKGAQGEYPLTAMQDVPGIYRNQVQPRKGSQDGATVQMNDELRSIIRFRQLNLMKEWPFKGLFDVIFCRNVMIYFDAPTKAHLIDRFIEKLKPGGWLYIGHSESLLGSHLNLKLVGRTIYRRSE